MCGYITLTFYVVVVSTLAPTHCIGTKKKKEFIACSQNVLNNAKTCCLFEQAVHYSVVTAKFGIGNVFKCIFKMSSNAFANKYMTKFKN